MKIFNEANQWYKGNLHTHTNLSDGQMSPADCIEIYKKEGYDFIAITDHKKFFKGFNQKEFMVISSTEFDVNDYETKRAYHITGIGLKSEIIQKKEFSPQNIIDAINKNGGIAIIAHPAWSLLKHDDLIELLNYEGIEIWNTVSEFPSGRGNSINYADVLGSKGRYPLLFAVDDTHFYTDDLFGGYIMVNCFSLDSEAILNSIKQGKFYCSQGPEIKQISITNGIISVETSPVDRILFLSDTFYCSDRLTKSDLEPVCYGEYSVKSTDSYVRIECIDKNNKRAWSQLLRVNN